MARRLIMQEPVSLAAIWSRRLIGFAVAVLGVAVLVARQGEPNVTGLAPIAGGYAIVLLALGLAVLAFIRIWQAGHRGIGMASQTFVLALLLLAPIGYFAFKAASLPRLNDVSTDIEEPPAFSRSPAALAARNGRVPADPTPAQRALQRQAYPKAVPILLDLPADIAFETARRAAAALGWQVTETVRPDGRGGAGRIEAVARTRILRFADDITVRVRPRSEGSRIDMRSASRLGSHDLGANAARIAAFAAELDLLAEAR